MNTGRGVGADARSLPSHERPDRPVVDLAGEVPQRDVQRPGPPGVEVDVGEHCRVAIEVERVLADEVALEVGEAVHRVAGADADVAGVVVDLHDRRREPGARARVPRGRKWWVEREFVVADVDAGDGVHGWPCTDPLRSSLHTASARAAS